MSAATRASPQAARSPQRDCPCATAGFGTRRALGLGDVLYRDAISSRAVTTSLAFWGRSLGFLASRRWIRSDSAWGVSGLSDFAGVTCWLATAIRVLIMSLPLNGSSPVVMK